jgi:hypothetical protein
VAWRACQLATTRTANWHRRTHALGRVSVPLGGDLQSPKVEPGPVAKSLYKGERLGKRPPCLICMGPGRGERAPLYLPGGVAVWLCAAHRSADFLTRRARRDLATSLLRAWQAAGCWTGARGRALDAHRARLAGPPARALPGSYAWPELRREAERRFAAGEAPARHRRSARARRCRTGRAPVAADDDALVPRGAVAERRRRAGAPAVTGSGSPASRSRSFRPGRAGRCARGSAHGADVRGRSFARARASP